MRTFIILWLGQLASAIGSAMTYFALTLWVWERTQSATAIALILVFYQLPQIAIALLSGLLVDRVSRKHLLIFSDIGSAVCTISVGILAALQLLQVWYIYAIAAIIGCFGNVQALTYSTLVPLIVPPAHHSRASSLAAMIDFGAAILSPALAGLLYSIVGLLGITAVDMATFAIAMVTLLLVPIPIAQNPEAQADGSPTEKTTVWQTVTFGFRYIAAQPSLVALVAALSAFTFLHQIGEALYQPMILARTGGDAQILGLVVAASGVGGVVGAIAFSVWGGFQRRQVGILAGFVGTGVSKLLLGVGPFPSLWALARFGTSFHNPLILSSYIAVWYAKVAPEHQGRVLSADYLIGTVAMLLANLGAGPLADRVFEPWMLEGNRLSPIFGTGPGSGMALLQVLLALGILVLGIVGLGLERIKQRSGYRV
jgi:MFS family permease